MCGNSRCRRETKCVSPCASTAVCRTNGNISMAPISHVSSHLYTLHLHFNVGTFDEHRLAFRLIHVSHEFRTVIRVKVVNKKSRILRIRIARQHFTHTRITLRVRNLYVRRLKKRDLISIFSELNGL